MKLRPRGRVARRFMKNRPALVALAYLVLLVLVAIFANWIAPKDPNAQDLVNRLSRPSGDYWLGSDGFGRDTFSRLVVASRVALVAAVQGLGVAVVLGIPIGLLAGYARGAVDAVLSRIADALLSIPPLIFALAVLGIAGTGLTPAMIAIGIILAPRFFRIARGAALSVVSEMYIEAARAEGLTSAQILRRHVLPNASGPLLVQGSFGIGFVITAEASLSFLGLGAQPPDASWGSMLRDAFRTINQEAFAIYPPTVMIVLTVLAFAVVGDALRDAVGRDSRGG